MAVATPARRRTMDTLGSERVRESLVGYAFVLVPLTLFGLFFIWPIVYSFYISAHQWGALVGKEAYVGLENYRIARDDEIFHRALRNTFVFAFTVVPLQMALGLVMAIVGQPGDPRADVLPRGLLLHLAAVRGRDRRDRDLHPLRQRPAQHGSARSGARFARAQRGSVVRRLGHGACVDRRPRRVDVLGDDDALLPRGAPGDPDRRLRGGRDRRRRNVADVLADHLPAAQARALLRRASSRRSAR